MLQVDKINVKSTRLLNFEMTFYGKYLLREKHAVIAGID